MGIAELESFATGCGQDRCSQIAIAVDHDEGTASLDDFQLRLAGTIAQRDAAGERWALVIMPARWK